MLEARQVAAFRRGGFGIRTYSLTNYTSENDSKDCSESLGQDSGWDFCNWDLVFIWTHDSGLLGLIHSLLPVN